MTLEFLVFANLVLALRLRLLLVDPAPGAPAWARKGAIELLAGLLFGWHAVTGLLAGVTILLNTAGYWAGRRRTQVEAWQLGLGVAHLLALSVVLSRAAGAAFCPELVAGFATLRSASVLGAGLERLASLRVQLALLGLLLSANEANLFLRAVFEQLKLKPRRAAGGEIDTGEYNRGRVIGLLERSLIYFFVLQGQFGVIGFTLAAKAFTRFKELEDRSFAEYVLIGTLLSSMLAVLAGTIVRLLG